MVVDLADRGDDRCGAAQAALGEGSVLDFLQGDFALGDAEAQVIAGNGDQGAAGDGGQDGGGLGHDQVAVLGDEEDVGAAGFLDLGAGCRIQVDIFSEAPVVGVHDGVQAHGIVEAGLDVPGAAWSCPVKVGDPDGNGLGAALEVGAHRRAEDAEHVVLSGLYPDDRGNAEHIRTQVKRGAAAVGRDPVQIGADGFNDGLDEAVLGEGRHLQVQCTVIHARCVQVRAERDHMSVLGGVGLEAFENGLGVLQNAGILAHGDHWILGEMAFIPGAVFVVGDKALVGHVIIEAQIAPVDVFTHIKNAPSRGYCPDFLPILAQLRPLFKAYCFFEGLLL